MEKIYKILANVDQGLTEEQKHQARTNIAAIAGVNVATSGGTTPLVPDENDRVTVDLTDIEGGVPPYTSSDDGKVLGVVGSSDPELQWVSNGGGSSFTAGNGIDITNDVISAKLDGTTLTNGSSGLSVTNPVPDTTGASQGDVLAVGSTGLEWVAPSGGSSKEFYAEYGTDASDNSYVTVSNGPGLDLKVNDSGFRGRAMAYTTNSGIPVYGTQATLRIADFQTNGKITLFNGNAYGNGYYPIWFPCTRPADGGFLRIISTAVYLKAKNTFNFSSSGTAQYVYTSTGSQVSLGVAHNEATIDFPSSATLDVDSTKFDKIGDWSSVTSPVYGNWALSFMDDQGNFSPLNWVGDSSETSTHLGIRLPLSMLDVKVWSGHGLDVNWGAGLYVTNPVPDTTGASTGDVLAVGSTGLEWVAPGGGGGGTFYAEYGVTTVAEINTAYNAGKTVIAFRSGDYLGTLYCIMSNQARFIRADPQSSLNPYSSMNLDWYDSVAYLSNGSTVWESGNYKGIPQPTSSDGNKVLSTDTYGNMQWVTPSGGSYSAGSGISISSGTISAKVDGTTVTVNANGELQAPTSQLPSYSSANSGESLVVNGNGDGVEWTRRISGVMYDGATSTELRRIRLNTYNNPSTPGLVAAFPTSGQGASCGFLMPDPGFVSDDTVDKVARIIENPNNSGVCMLEYQDDAAVISPLEKVSISTSTSPYEISVQPGKWYEIVCSQSSAQTWHIYLEANSIVTTNTVHTIVRITRTDSNISCSPELVWHDERGTIHYESCDLTGTTSYYDFDCLVRKNGYTVGGTPWSFARVKRI